MPWKAKRRPIVRVGDVVSRSRRRESVRASDTPSSHIWSAVGLGRCFVESPLRPQGGRGTNKVGTSPRVPGGIGRPRRVSRGETRHSEGFMRTREIHRVQAKLIGSDKPTRRGRSDGLMEVRLVDSPPRSGKPSGTPNRPNVFAVATAYCAPLRPAPGPLGFASLSMSCGYGISSL